MLILPICIFAVLSPFFNSCSICIFLVMCLRLFVGLNRSTYFVLTKYNFCMALKSNLKEAHGARKVVHMMLSN